MINYNKKIQDIELDGIPICFHDRIKTAILHDCEFPSVESFMKLDAGIDCLDWLFRCHAFNGLGGGDRIEEGKLRDWLKEAVTPPRHSFVTEEGTIFVYPDNSLFTPSIDNGRVCKLASDLAKELEPQYPTGDEGLDNFILYYSN